MRKKSLRSKGASDIECLNSILLEFHPGEPCDLDAYVEATFNVLRETRGGAENRCIEFSCNVFGAAGAVANE